MVRPRQFDICRVTGQQSGSSVDLAVVLQHDISSTLATRIVAPLIPADESLRAGHATPEIVFEGSTYIVAIHLLGAVPVRNLEIMANIEQHEALLKKALDFMFLGV